MQKEGHSYFEVKTARCTFVLSFRESDLQRSVTLGGRKKNCVEIFVPKKHPDPRFSFLKTNVATVPSIKYDKGCCFDRELDRGEGTRYMVKTAFHVVRMLSPDVEWFELEDASKFQCDGWGVSLAHYSVALYGKTWYQRYFGARMKDEALHQVYVRNLERFTEPVNLPFDHVFRTVASEFRGSLEAIRPLYDEKESLVTFFNKARESLKGRFCELTHAWIERFVNSVLEINVNSAWVIPASRANTNVTSVTLTALKKAPDFSNASGGGSEFSACHLIVDKEFEF